MQNKLKKWTKEFLDFFLDFLFKERCIGCRKKDEIICDDCVSLFHLPHDNPTDTIFAAFSYKDSVVKKILINLKYYHKKNLGKKLGAILYDRMLEEISEIKNLSGEKIILIPIPMTKSRLHYRGYNQSLLIVRGIYEASKDIRGNSIFEIKKNILIKTKDTVPQAKIKDRKKRFQNLKGHFVCAKQNEIRGRTIIVVDDVTTTGSTITEAMRSLKKGKAKKVFGFVIAH